jgi:hypothetical protein
MTRIVFSLFALALAVSFSACEGRSVAELPPHYQHKVNHGSDEHESGGAGAEKHTEAAKDSKHKEEAKPAHP